MLELVYKVWAALATTLLALLAAAMLCIAGSGTPRGAFCACANCAVPEMGEHSGSGIGIGHPGDKGSGTTGAAQSCGSCRCEDNPLFTFASKMQLLASL